MYTCLRQLAFLEYLDCLRRTYVFTCHTEYTVFFSYHEGLFVRCWVTGRIKPFEYIDRACFNTCAVCNADVKVIAYFLTPYTQLSWRVNWPPYFDSLIGPSYLPFFFEFGLNWAFRRAVACSCSGECYSGWDASASSCCCCSCWNRRCWCSIWCFGRSSSRGSSRLGRSYLRSHCLLSFNNT